MSHINNVKNELTTYPVSSRSKSSKSKDADNVAYEELVAMCDACCAPLSACDSNFFMLASE